jgi:ribonuclease P protein component
VLPDSSRLRRSDDIVTVVRQGYVVQTPYVRVFALPKLTTPSRVACVVGRKVSPQAVIRHRYQRWLRTYARTLLASLRAGADIVLVGLPALTSVTSLAELEQSLQGVASRLDKVLASRKN